MTDREEYEAWVDANFDRRRVPRISVEFGFEVWVASRRALIAASGAPVEIKVIGEAKS